VKRTKKRESQRGQLQERGLREILVEAANALADAIEGKPLRASEALPSGAGRRSGMSELDERNERIRLAYLERAAADRRELEAWARRLVLPLLGLLLRPVTEGAAPVLWAATDPALARASGAVFNRRRQHVRLNRASADATGAKLLWEESERLLEVAPWP
jgi:hypothetical protein